LASRWVWLPRTDGPGRQRGEPDCRCGCVRGDASVSALCRSLLGPVSFVQTELLRSRTSRGARTPIFDGRCDPAPTSSAASLRNGTRRKSSSAGRRACLQRPALRRSRSTG
jgi:hypothetical protein